MLNIIGAIAIIIFLILLIFYSEISLHKDK